MRAHVLVQPGQLELHELPRPRPAPGGVVVRVRAALTCGTDIKTYLRGHPIFPTPTVFGHEFAGELAEVGPGVGELRPGDAIMAVPTAPCGHCFHCQREQENLCPQVKEAFVLGGFADFVALPAAIVRRNLFRKPAVLPYREAALLEPLSCVVQGLAQVAVRPDDTVVLIGAGAIALLHLLVLRARGIGSVLCIVRSPARAAQVRSLGAEALLAANPEEAAEVVRQRSGGRGADLVIECTGQVSVWEAAPQLARRGGQVVLFGGCAVGSRAHFDTTRLHYDQVRLISPFHFTPRDVRAAYHLLESGTFGGGALIGAEYPLEGLAEALARQRRGEAPKFAIVP